MRVEAELESMTRKSHDASGQLVSISQELLKKERYRDKCIDFTICPSTFWMTTIHHIINLIMDRLLAPAGLDLFLFHVLPT